MYEKSVLLFDVCIMCIFVVVFVVVCLFVCFLIADKIFHLGVYYVYYYMLVQRFEPQGRSLTNFHYYYYCSVHMIVIIVSGILIYFDVCYFLLGVFIKFISSNFVLVLLHDNTQFISRKKDATFYLNKRSNAEDVRAQELCES